MSEKAVNTLLYNALGTDGTNNVAQVLVDAAQATLWDISLVGTPTGNDAAVNVVPQWCLVDNIKNNQNVTVSFSNVSLTVPAFQRESIPIPNGVRVMSFAVSVGVTNVYFSEAKLANDQDNNLLIQQTAVKTLIYAFVTYAATVSQQASDQNASVDFVPVAGAMNYNLLGIAAAPIGNGWFEFLYNNGTKDVSLVPNAADILNYNGQLYTAASPLILHEGAAGYLSSDGSQWYYAGTTGAAGNPVVIKTVTSAQLSGDNTSKTVFEAAGAISYNLLAIAGNVANGWSQQVQNLGGNTVSFVPNGADKINTIFANAAPMVMRPGDSGILSSDGIQWFFQGRLSFQASISPIPAAGNPWLLNVAHGLGKIPDQIALSIQNTIANDNYSVGDEVDIGSLSSNATTNSFVTNIFKNATNVGIASEGIANTKQLLVANKTTGAASGITPADWNLVLRAFVHW